MSNQELNKLHLQLAINRNADNTYRYQYYSLFDNGVVVKVDGFIIDKPTRFKVELSKKTKDGYIIKECLVPGHQDVVTVESLNDHKVTLLDKDNEADPEDYNFIIIALDVHSGKEIVCDPQIRNKGTF